MGDNELEGKIIAVDFDGTIVEHEFPEIGAPVPGALEALKELHAAGAKIVLWTVRSSSGLNRAVEYLQEKGIPLYGVNGNPEQNRWSSSPKAYCHIYIDDAALGCPLVLNLKGRPYVDWAVVRRMLGLKKPAPFDPE